MYTKLFGSFCFIDDWSWQHSILASNGKIYAVGSSSFNYISCLDPTTDFFTNIDLDLDYNNIGWYHLVETNNKLYAIPNGSSDVVCVDLTDNSVTLFGSFSSKYWAKGIVAPNGKIYCVPETASSQVLCIDPTDNSYTTFGDTSGLASSGWSDGILVGNKIYCIPSRASAVLCIDTTNDTISTFGSLSTARRKYMQGVLYNGKIYAVPYCANDILCIDTTSESISSIGDFSYVGGDYKFGYSLLAPNNKIYAAPYNANFVLCVDPTTDTFETFGNLSSYGSYKWYSMVKTSTDDIYAIPESAEYILKIDYTDNTLSVTPISNPYNYGWVHSVVLPNDDIYCLPNGANVLKISQGEEPQMNYEYEHASIVSVPFDSYNKWSSAVVVSDKIYGIPKTVPSLLYIDTTKTNELTTLDIPYEADYYGCSSAVVVGSKIYGIPSTANNVLCVDTIDNTITSLGSFSGDSYNHKWSKGILAPNGKIYGVPYRYNAILRIDTSTDTVDTIGSGLYNEDWSDGVLVGNKVYIMPFSADHVLCIDTTDDTITNVADFSTIIGTDSPKCSRYVLAPNGKIYGIPSYGNSVICFDPSTNTLSKIGDFYYDGLKWNHAVMTPDGKIYCVPYYADTVLCVDTTNDSYTTFGQFEERTNKWNNAVLGADGKIYAFPSNTTHSFLCVDPEINKANIINYNRLNSGDYLYDYCIMGNDDNIYGIPNNSRHVFKLSQIENIPPNLNDVYHNMYVIGNPILTETLDVNNIDSFKINDEIWFCLDTVNIYVDTIQDTFGKLSLSSDSGGEEL